MTLETLTSKLDQLLSLRRIIQFPVSSFQFPQVKAQKHVSVLCTELPRKRYLIKYILLCALCSLYPSSLNASPDIACLNIIDPSDAILIAAPDGHILFKRNETKKYIPASTLKILTALTAIHHFGLSHRFQTKFYTDPDGNLIIKGFGDPLLTSEVWLELSEILADKIQRFNDLILDDSYFSQQIKIPGVEKSTNPYDAPLGALCANFNTVFFDHDSKGRVISAEPQTPMTPFAREKIAALGQKKGRYTFSHDQQDTARYAGELLLHFLNQRGVNNNGEICLGTIDPEDKLIYTYYSNFTLESVIKKMLEFSNNFVANQICIALGVHVYGQPGTLEKGVLVISEYAKEELHLADLDIVEGSGISRQNRISALDMLVVLKKFRPYRRLLKRSGKILFKTGTLKGINTRAGYMESSTDTPCPFVIFLNNGDADIERLMSCIENQIAH